MAAKLTRTETTQPVYSCYFPAVPHLDRLLVEAVADALAGQYSAKTMKDIISLSRYHIAGRGAVVVVRIGSVAKAVMPTRKDLLEARTAACRVVVKSTKTAPAYTPVFATEFLFFPPVVDVVVGGTMVKPTLVFSLGDREHNTLPTREDLKALSALVAPIAKRLRVPGLADVRVVVKSA